MKLSLEELGSLKVFKRQDISKDDIAASGEVFYPKLYRATTAKTSGLHLIILIILRVTFLTFIAKRYMMAINYIIYMEYSVHWHIY